MITLPVSTIKSVIPHVTKIITDASQRTTYKHIVLCKEVPN